MNMGTASDIKNFDAVLKFIKKILKPGGKFFLSFYNSESLVNKIEFLPWPVPLAAHIDTDKCCLEVEHNNKFYFLYAQQRSVREIKALLSDFIIDKIQTYPTLASIVPKVITGSEDKTDNYHPNKEVCATIKLIDERLAGLSDCCFGSYIAVTGEKK